MNDNVTGKRSLFAPIVLILLVLSSIGNVLLYSIKLQNDQQSRADRGERIIRSAWEGKQHAEQLQEQVNKLLQAGDLQQLMIAKQGIGFAFHQADALVYFVNAAVSARQQDDEADHAQTFLAAVEQTLLELSAHAGELTQQELQELTGIAQIYAELDSVLARFRVSELTEQTALRTEHGGLWIELGGELLQLMKDWLLLHQAG